MQRAQRVSPSNGTPQTKLRRRRNSPSQSHPELSSVVLCSTSQWSAAPYIGDTWAADWPRPENAADPNQCDKVRPQCTQCVRVGRQCPGYRDQLSLMFRDESTKVIQKAHAQWGVQDSPDGSEASGSSPTSTSPTSSLGGRTRTSFTESVSSGSPVSPDGSRLTATRVPREVHATLFDRAVQFYLEHYVIGLPDEAKAGKDLRQEPWVFSTVTRDTMAAVGLASQSNLTGDKELMALARQQYGLALQGTAFGLRDIQGLDVGVYLRAIVMLGMFEVSARSSCRAPVLCTVGSD